MQLSNHRFSLHPPLYPGEDERGGFPPPLYSGEVSRNRDGGVLNVEFHSKMNSLGEDQMSLVQAAFDECEKWYEERGMEPPPR